MNIINFTKSPVMAIVALSQPLSDRMINMATFWLFMICLAAWGPSWYAITFQIAEVSPEVSVGIRFLLAGVLFAIFCWLRGDSLALTRRQFLRVAGVALLLFSTNYIIIYHATHHLSSGLVSVIHSTLPIANMVNAWLLLREKTSAQTWCAAAIGLVGIALVFHQEWQVFVTLEGKMLLGIGLSFLATFVASLGNIAAMQNQRYGVEIKPATAIGMMIGGATTLAFAAATGHEIRLPLTLPFLGSLLFLAVMSSIVAFFVYFKLLERIGAGRSAYVALVYPMIAIYISTVFENYEVDAIAIGGFALIMVGNGLILMQKDRKPAPAVAEAQKNPSEWIPAKAFLATATATATADGAAKPSERPV